MKFTISKIAEGLLILLSEQDLNGALAKLQEAKIPHRAGGVAGDTAQITILGDCTEASIRKILDPRSLLGRPTN